MAIISESINDNQKHNYDNRRSYNNAPLKEGECLVPILVTWDTVKHFNMCTDNLETWHFSGRKVLVAFAPVKLSSKGSSMKFFWKDVHEYLASFKTEGTLSYDQFLEDAESEDGKGYDPAATTSLEDTALLRMIIDDLIRQVEEINPKYGRILELIKSDYSKGEILSELNLGKSQGYSDIKAAQKLAKDLYSR